jgi:hypothetical protein
VLTGSGFGYSSVFRRYFPREPPKRTEARPGTAWGCCRGVVSSASHVTGPRITILGGSFHQGISWIRFFRVLRVFRGRYCLGLPTEYTEDTKESISGKIEPDCGLRAGLAASILFELRTESFANFADVARGGSLEHGIDLIAEARRSESAEEVESNIWRRPRYRGGLKPRVFQKAARARRSPKRIGCVFICVHLWLKDRGSSPSNRSCPRNTRKNTKESISGKIEPDCGVRAGLAASILFELRTESFANFADVARGGWLEHGIDLIAEGWKWGCASEWIRLF